jgi:hypothetical protein
MNRHCLPPSCLNTLLASSVGSIVAIYGTLQAVAHLRGYFTGAGRRAFCKSLGVISMN